MNRLLNLGEMKFYFRGLAVCFLVGSNIGVCEEKTVREISGELILLHDDLVTYQRDDNPFGVAEVFILFERRYQENIQYSPINTSLNFFWMAMFHLGFDGDYMEQFQEIVYKDCGKQFINRLHIYIGKEQALKRSTSRLHLAKQVLAGLHILDQRIPVISSGESK